MELDHDLTLLHWAEHPENFIFSGALMTQDERDQKNPVKPLPDKEYLRIIVREVYSDKVILLPKSRQLMCTWIMCAYALWQALMHPHQKVFLQSKKEEDAAKLVFDKVLDGGRIGFIYSRLPEWVKARVGAVGSFAKLSLSNGSLIWGVPQGSDIIRSYTASLFITDECAFQPEFENAYTSAKPMAGKIVGLSTANQGYFADLVTEVLPPSETFGY